MENLQHILKNPKQNSRVSPYLSDLLSDLGIVAEFMRQLTLFQPWAATMDYDLTVHGVEAQKIWDPVGKTKLTNLGRFATQIKISTIIMPIQKTLRYHWNKRTEQSVATMRDAEATLETFWKAVDTDFKTNTGKTLVNTHHNESAKMDRPLWRTPEWVEKTKVLKPDLKLEMREPLSSLLNEKDVRKVPNATTAEKTKIKTKGVPAAESEKGNSPLMLQKTPALDPIFIGKATLKVFSALFYTPNKCDVLGEITWTAFLSRRGF